MILYKPSDKISSDPIEFWFMPEPENNFQIANPAFSAISAIANSALRQQGLSQLQNPELKRPKQRMCDEDSQESTGMRSNSIIQLQLWLV